MPLIAMTKMVGFSNKRLFRLKMPERQLKWLLFSALPGGYRNTNGNFNNLGNNGNWWSATENSSTNAWNRNLNYDNGNVKRNSGTTSTLSNSDTPGHDNFILATYSPADWRSPQNDNLWQGVNGINNPCPVGYRLPTEAEWEAERQSWSSNNAAGAFNSPLKLPVAGSRYGSNGSLFSVGSSGRYWSATVGGTYAWRLNFHSSANMTISSRAYGFSVRCLKD